MHHLASVQNVRSRGALRCYIVPPVASVYQGSDGEDRRGGGYSKDYRAYLAVVDRVLGNAHGECVGWQGDGGKHTKSFGQTNGEEEGHEVRRSFDTVESLVGDGDFRGAGKQGFDVPRFAGVVSSDDSVQDDTLEKKGVSKNVCSESGVQSCAEISGVNGVVDTQGVIAVSGIRRGRWYEHNKQKKIRARQLKESGVKVENIPEWRRKSGSVDVVSGEDGRLEREKRSKEKFELQCSLEKKWAAENELRQFEAERKLRVLKSQDEDTIIRMQRAQVMRTTEKCKVDTERAFKSLLRTGNVSGLPAGGAGSVETVVSEGGVPSLTRSNGESISPDSSASMQEFRKCQKDLLDAEKKNQEQGEVLERLALMHPDDYAKAHAIATMKTAYTLDSNGEAEYVVDGQLGSDGKIHVDNLNDIYGPNYAHKKYKELREMEGDDLIY